MREELKTRTKRALIRLATEWCQQPGGYTPEEALKEWFTGVEPEKAQEEKDAMLEMCLTFLVGHHPNYLKRELKA